MFRVREGLRMNKKLEISIMVITHPAPLCTIFFCQKYFAFFMHFYVIFSHIKSLIENSINLFWTFPYTSFTLINNHNPPVESCLFSSVLTDVVVEIVLSVLGNKPLYVWHYHCPKPDILETMKLIWNTFISWMRNIFCKTFLFILFVE